ncbi:MAG: pro-sigmaK processing inhibitor BofA family protein [Candidatus Micrarchaeales archaeon]
MFPLIAALLISGLLGSIGTEVALVVGIIIVLLIVFTLGKFLVGILTNSILGLISFFLLNTFFGLGIPITIPTVLVTAIFGLPAVAIIVLLRILGVPL